MILSHIVAIDQHNGIGKNNDLLVKIPEDQKFFRETTKGKIMIMGRKTFDSLGKPLVGRYHIVVTRQKLHSDHPMVTYVSSLDEAYKKAKNLIAQNAAGADGISKWPDEVFLIGGAEIYKQSLPQTNCLYISKIEQTFDADTFYPNVNWNEFDLKSQTQFETSPKFSVNVYCRKN
jgi:dihydrofolate reductase